MSMVEYMSVVISDDHFSLCGLAAFAEFCFGHCILSLRGSKLIVLLSAHRGHVSNR